MRDSKSSPNLAHPQHNSSIRLRKRRDHVKQQFLKNRRSGDFSYSLNSDAVTDNTDDILTNTKVATLDPGPSADGLQHNLRPLLRNKYRQHPLSDTEEYAGKVWGHGRPRRGGHPGEIKITDFGMIDHPQDSTLSEKRVPMYEPPEPVTHSSLNCFGVSSGSTVLEREDCGPLSLPPHPSTSSPLSLSDSPLVRGVMWVQRERIFSRWKERFFILTKDYLQCFKRGTTQVTEMGAFLFQIRLSDIQSVTLVDRRGYLTVVVEIEGEENLLIRRPEKLREWYNILHKMVKESKARVMKSKDQFWAKKTVMDSEKIEEWLVARTRIGSLYQYTTDIPRSTSSMDRRQNKQKKRAKSEYISHNVDELSQASAPLSLINMRSKSVDRKNHLKDTGNRAGKENVKSAPKFSNVKGVVLSEDSGNCSLNTSTTDSRKSVNSCDNLSRGGDLDLWVKDTGTRGRYS